MGNLLAFALIGLVATAGARLMYPGRQPTHIMGTMLLGIIGAVVGGMISRIWWPAVDDAFHPGNLILSVLGAMVGIVFLVGVACARSNGGPRNASPGRPHVSLF